METKLIYCPECKTDKAVAQTNQWTYYYNATEGVVHFDHYTLECGHRVSVRRADPSHPDES